MPGSFFHSLGSRNVERKEQQVARKTVVVSDLSGKAIPDGKGAVVTVRFNDTRKGTIVMDVTDEEGASLGAKGRKQARRGRPPRA